MIGRSSSRGRQRGGSTTRGGRARGRRGAQRSNVTPTTLPWCTVQPATDSAPLPLVFSAQTGPTIQMPINAKPVDFFRHLFDDAVLHLIVNETNR